MEKLGPIQSEGGLTKSRNVIVAEAGSECMFAAPMKTAFTRTFFALVLSTVAARAQVVINEILYDPADVTKQEEFIELHNPGGAAVDISGWRIEDGVSFTMPAGTTIPAGGFRVVAQNPAQFQSRYGFAPLGPWTGTLANSGNRITLKNTSAVVVDEVNYGSGFPWPTAARGAGNSMELIHPSLDNNLGGSWRASATTPETVLIPRSTAGWRYRETRSDPPSTWKELAFDDTGAEWAACTMPAGFALSAQFTPAVTWGQTLGYGGNTADKTRTYYFRRKFNIANPAAVTSIVFRIRRDDAAVMWLNNDSTMTVVSADAAGAWNPATTPYTYSTLGPNATTGTPGLSDYATFTIPGSKLVAGDNIVAIELHQSSVSSSDLLIDAEVVIPGLTGGSPGTQNAVFSTLAPPQIRQVEHTPEQPAAGVPILISARITDPQGVAGATLSYQLVDPGSYIRLTDAAYATTWTNVAMNDAGTDGDVLAGDGIFSATLPAALQTNRRLVRYRISATDGTSAVTVPYADDEQPNFAYYVYNGVPAYSGVVQSGAAGARGATQTFPPALLNTKQIWTIITNATDHDNMLYNGSFNGVQFYGTFVYEGKVYDHIKYNNRGIGSTYVSGKNKFALKFNRARDVRVRNNWGNYFDKDWNSVPVDACASPWAAVHRGMAGVEEAIGYRLYELAGMSSLRTTYLHLRVVRGVNEAGTGQYDTDFWGLYMALEPTEGNFLDERNLPDGNVYAIESGSAGGADKKHQGPTQPVTTADWTTFSTNAVAAGQTEAWYRANIDLNAYYTFFALNRFTGNVDVRPGDNYRYYHRPTDDRWVIIPYDLDMMSLPAHHWGGTLADGNVWAGAPSQSVLLSRHPTLALEFRNRARELMSLIGSDNSASGGQIGQLIDEYAQLVKPGGTAPSWVEADEVMWSNHPRTAGTGANSGQTSHKNNFFRTPFSDSRGGLGGTTATNWTRTLPDPDGDGYATFADQMNYLKNFMTNTWSGGAWVRSNGNPAGYGWKYLEWESQYGGWGNANTAPSVAPDADFPATPTITYAGPLGYPANSLDFNSSAFSDPQGAGTFAAVQWRIGEIYAPGIPGYVAGEKRRYEVEEVWTSAELGTIATQRIPLVSVEPGRTYRARVRHKDTSGRWSFWSAPITFVAGTPDVSAYASSLVVTEVNYNPAPVTPVEFAAGFSSDDFEWVEIKNIGALPVDLTGVRFTKGIDFDFPANWTIQPGGFALVVRNLAAFQSRWGTSFNSIIAGVTADNFSNGGDEVKLSYGQGTEIFRFVYDDIAPWPTQSDGAGRTLVMNSPAPIPLANQTNGSLWRASYAAGGSPGADDVLTFDIWNDDFPGVNSLTADNDGDGLVNLVEYALATNPLSANAGPVSGVGTYTVLGVPGTYLVLTFTRRANGSDLTIEAQFNTALPGAWSANGVLEISVTNPDGTVTETWRSPYSLSEQPVQFGRVRVIKP
ncbi:MAG: hypothetical protein RL088_261 [Verrucomicrobiota bacterium]|jgi:hypothetical protein